MNYMIALVAMPVMMVVWVAVQRWAADDPNEDALHGGCDGCTCGHGGEACEKRAL